VRWVPILLLVAIGTMINYLDRTVLGIAAPSLSKDLGLSPTEMGFVFSAFSWSYAALQIPGGIFLDRYGTRLTYFIAVAFWSLFTAMMGVVRSFGALIATRIGVGVFEAPCFPANSRILATWFPQHERARANSPPTSDPDAQSPALPRSTRGAARKPAPPRTNRKKWTRSQLARDWSNPSSPFGEPGDRRSPQPHQSRPGH
jgi:hypothetical protein